MGDQIDGWVDQPKIYRAGMAIVVQIIIIMHTKNRSLAYRRRLS